MKTYPYDTLVIKSFILSSRFFDYIETHAEAAERICREELERERQ